MNYNTEDEERLRREEEEEIERWEDLALENAERIEAYNSRSGTDKSDKIIAWLESHTDEASDE